MNSTKEENSRFGLLLIVKGHNIPRPTNNTGNLLITTTRYLFTGPDIKCYEREIIEYFIDAGILAPA